MKINPFRYSGFDLSEEERQIRELYWDNREERAAIDKYKKDVAYQNIFFRISMDKFLTGPNSYLIVDKIKEMAIKHKVQFNKYAILVVDVCSRYISYHYRIIFRNLEIYDKDLMEGLKISGCRYQLLHTVTEYNQQF